MGNTCRYCAPSPQPDLHFIDNRLPHLYPRQFYNETIFALATSLGEYRFYFRPYELPPQPQATQNITIQGPILDQTSQCKYYGQMTETGVRAGQGKQLWPDHTLYQGYFQLDKPHGKGRMFHPQGDLYEGDWFQGKKHGKGIMKKSNGQWYNGTWKDDKPHGKGSEGGLKGYGGRYSGQYREGKKEGEGKMEWDNGDVYQGEFRDDKIEGIGTMFWKEGGRSYQGEWKDGIMQGNGIMTFIEGRKYTGQFQKDKFHGEGVFSWPDGRTYQGQFYEGIPQGRGQYKMKNNIFPGKEWHQGKPIVMLQTNEKQVVEV